jgi:hypothetical protein
MSKISKLSLQQLREGDFSDEVVAAVDALTKRPGESRMDAAARAKANSIALRSRLADNAYNQDMTRIAKPTARTSLA